MNFEDKELVCTQCRTNFIWTFGEQEFIQGLIDDGKTGRDGRPIVMTTPKRCKECRLKRKQEKERQQDSY